MNNLDRIRNGEGLPPIGTHTNITLKRKPNTTKPRRLTVDVSIKGVEEFKMLTNIFTRIITDERIDKNIRQNYLDELISNVGD